MSNVWVTIPSARPPEVVAEWAKAWRERGYKIALMFDNSDALHLRVGSFDRAMNPVCGSVYPGYAESINALVFAVSQEFLDAEWFIAAGDDVFPDPNHSAEEIARECYRHFSEAGFKPERGTFGVMQPTGDRWGESPNHPNPKMRSAYIDRVCGSAWIGREFARRINQGKGPLWPEYFHMGVDEELQAVALKYGVLWQRLDLVHDHRHWGKPEPGHRIGHASNMPPFLEKANSPKEWKKYKGLFETRNAEGFPGSEPL